MSELREIATRTRAWACYDCGKCTATCPVSRAGADYSPRRHVLSANSASLPEVVSGSAGPFRCLTCRLCDERCPAEVDYTNLVMKLREISFREGVEPECPHGGALQSMMRMMAKGGNRQNRLEWLTDDLETVPESGDVLYWTGCTMYYDAYFPELGSATLEGTKAAIRLLNRSGVTPVVSPEERCCGHDLLWNGDRGSFESLARHNVRLVAESGAHTVVTSCAECLRTWTKDYFEYFEGRPPRVVHISDYLAENVAGLRLSRNGARTVTYQDPCRMGRHLGLYDPPRDLLRSVPGVEVREMRHNRSSATCCAGGTWSACDVHDKHIQVERLREARATGAAVMVTACPKCQIHFRCAMKDPNVGEQIGIELRDVAEVVAAALKDGKGEGDER